MPTVTLTKAQIDDLVRRGLIPPVKPKKPKAAAVVDPEFATQPCGKCGGDGDARGGGRVFPGTDCGECNGTGVGNRVTITAPVKTASESNARAWREKSNRTREARRVLSAVLGPNLRHLAPLAEHYHGGGVLEVVITRLGGKKLDAMSNLGASLKATEDFICLVLGTDDGDPRWKCRADQEVGGPVGVRIVIARG